jgi:hypothetical protein
MQEKCRALGRVWCGEREWTDLRRLDPLDRRLLIQHHRVRRLHISLVLQIRNEQ